MAATGQGGYEQPQYEQEEGGLTGALNRQLGPLKVWQWGIAVGGAVLLYLVIKGRGSGGSSGAGAPAFVPASTDANGNPTLGDLSNIPVPNITVQITQNITKKLLYYKDRLGVRTNIYDKAGKVIGHLPAGRTILLGAKVRIGGVWYYPILNMPGHFLRDTASLRAGLTPIYSQTVDTPTVTTNAVPAVSTSQEGQPYFIGKIPVVGTPSNTDVPPPTLAGLNTNGGVSISNDQISAHPLPIKVA